jgi:aldehyde:ferredoxin oxidoreductase
MSASECIAAYLEMSEKVFGQAQGLTHREKFDPNALEQAIKDIVKRKTGNEDAPLRDSTCCKT